MRSRIEVPGIADKELRKLLEEHELLDALEAGELTCSCCSSALSWENIGGFLVKNGSFVLLCDSSECIEIAISGGNE